MKIKIFKCFSVPLKQFLMNRGLEYIAVALDPKTKNTMWMFVKNEELDEALTIWKQTKPRDI